MKLNAWSGNDPGQEGKEAYLLIALAIFCT